MFNFDDLNFDAQHIWHPYTSMRHPLPCYPIISAKGCYLKLADGRKLIDGMSSWWAAIHGYNNIHLNQAMKHQINLMPHVMFGGITHPAAILLCRKLIKITPENLQCVFLADSGSIAIEVAMKMAMQYWLGKGEPRYKFLAIKHSYHGDTFAAMSVCDPQNSMHNLWQEFLPKQIFADISVCRFHESWNASLEDLYNKIVTNNSDIAAIILEPIVQGAGGMHFYHPYYLKKIKELCNYYNILLIADEIATGFGRTGKLFACEHAQVVPDILCLGKALTGGTMTLAATLTTFEIADTISNSKASCLMHGPTFMGNPLACAVAYENLILLEKLNWYQKVSIIEKNFYDACISLKNHSEVLDIRILGAICVIETKKLINVSAIQKFFVKNNVWIRPFKKIIYLTPPYIITAQEIEILISVIAKALKYSQLFE